MSAPLRVGITGGIGSGKTALTNRLAQLGIAIVDADLIAREIVEPGSPALDEISKHFGADILDAGGALNRPKLRRIVFANPVERQWLEALTHPLIAATIKSRLAAANSPYVVLSSPLLLEGSQRDQVDHIVVVDVPESVQLERTMSRDNNDEALVSAIMASQLPRSERLAFADMIIDNSGSLQDLQRKADSLHKELVALASAA